MGGLFIFFLFCLGDLNWSKDRQLGHPISEKFLSGEHKVHRPIILLLFPLIKSLQSYNFICASELPVFFQDEDWKLEKLSSDGDLATPTDIALKLLSRKKRTEERKKERKDIKKTIVPNFTAFYEN